MSLKKDFFGSFVTLLYQRSPFGTGESYSASTKNDLLTNAYEGLTLGHKGIHSIKSSSDNYRFSGRQRPRDQPSSSVCSVRLPMLGRHEHLCTMEDNEGEMGMEQFENRSDYLRSTTPLIPSPLSVGDYRTFRHGEPKSAQR